MAGKINTKFISLLAIFVLLLAIGAGVFYSVFVRKSNADLMAAGDKHLLLAETAEQTSLASKDNLEAFASARNESGMNYRLAAESYGLAYRRDRSNVDVLLKYIAARRKMAVSGGAQASRVLKEIAGLTREATELRRDDDELLDGYYQQLYSWGKMLGATSFFNQLHTLTSSKLETDPDNLVAIKFNCIARSLTLSESVDRDQQAEILNGLERVLEDRPDDTDTMHFLARWHLFDAKRLTRAHAEPAAIQAALDQARGFAQTAFDSAPNNGDVAIEFLTILLDPLMDGLDDAKPVLEGLVAYLADNPDPPALVARVSRLLPSLKRERLETDSPNSLVTTGVAQAETLLRRAVELRPGTLMFQLLLAENLKNQLRLDEAHALFVAARDYKISAPFDIALRDESLRRQAIYEVANIELIRAEATTEDPAKRKLLLTQADDAIDILEAVDSESAQVLMLRGKTSLLRGEHAQALIAIDKASDLYSDRNIEALLLSARARQSRKQWGAAAERLRQSLALMGGESAGGTASSVRLQLAEMLIRSRDFNEAQRHLRQVLQQPETGLNEAQVNALHKQQTMASILQTRSLAGQGKMDAAIAQLEDLDTNNNPQAARALANLYQQAGQTDRAQEILKQQAQNNPTDIRLLQQRLALANQADRPGILQDAQTAGVDAAVIGQLQSTFTGEVSQDPGDRIDQTLKPDATPLNIALAKSKAYARSGDSEKAKHYFEQARELDPNGERVVIMGIDYAIAEQDFDKAGTLVADAARRNLDLADGHFLRGKLASAQGDIQQAMASFEMGLKKRPVFDEGWRLYGDLRLRSNEAEAAASAYKKALGQRPSNIAALVGLANAQNRQGHRSDALDSLRSAVAYAPANAAVVEQYMNYESRHGRRERVLEMREKLVQSSPSNLNNRLNLALLQAREGQRDTALKTVDQAETDISISRDTVGARAGVLGITGTPDEGVAVVRQWVKQRGDEAQDADRMLLSRYLMSVGRIDDAVTAYQTAAELANDKASINRELADVLFNNNRPAEATVLYRKLFDSSEEDEKQRLGLRLAEAHLRANEAEQATATLDLLEADAVNDALRAMVAMSEGKTDDALTMVNRAIEKNPNASSIYLQRAQIRLQIPGADLNDALADLNQLLGIQPNHMQALGLKARVLSAMGRSVDAADALQSLLEAQPGNHPVRELLARTLVAAGNPSRASFLVAEGLKLA
ncbi:MAG: tetratricopeptide repeat protein, partial [Algisphaera sp.]